MTPENNAGSSWDRVAAELRACRDAQQRAWGDIDNTTLGRFLAGEVTPQEQQQIEAALETLPELRKLTDLVRDVLGATEPAAPQTRKLTAASERPTTGPWLQRQRGRATNRFRSYAVLATAACLLWTLGVALPRSRRRANSEPSSSVAYFHPVAERTASFDAERAVALAEPQRETELLARQYINNFTRQARVYQENGDFVRAEPVLNRAHLLSAKTLGPDAPETVRTRKSLAGLYVAALNAPPTLSVAFARNESPLQKRSVSSDKKAFDDRRRDAPRVLALRSLPPPRPDSHALAKPRFAPPPRSGYRPPEQQTASDLRQRIRRQKLNEVRDCVVPVLVQSLREAKDGAERQRLARALGQLGPAAGAAVPVLLDAYRHSGNTSERIVLLSALGQIGPPARSAAPLLVEALRGGDADLRRTAARTLLRIGPVARGCCQDLTEQSKRDPLILEVLQRIDGAEGRSGIDDEAGCFSVESTQQARDIVLRLAKTAHLAVRVETVAAPAAFRKKKDTFKRETRPNGVCLCIEKQPADVQVFICDEVRKQGLSDAALRQALEPYVRAQDFDGALQAGLRFLDDFEKKQAQGR
jgi:hypothetical protein